MRDGIGGEGKKWIACAHGMGSGRVEVGAVGKRGSRCSCGDEVVVIAASVSYAATWLKRI